MLKYLFLFVLILILLFVFRILYAFKIEPHRVKLKRININNESNDFVKIIQFTDIHIKEDFTYKNLDKVINRINEQKPDIVILTGDLYDNYKKYNDDQNIIEELKKINAKYAKIAVWGNRDYGGGAVKNYENIMKKSGFIILKNENLYITTDTNKKILFTGLDDSMLGDVHMPKLTKKYHPNYSILLTHEPDIIDLYKEYTYDLVLSGHSHGGQINIPFIPIINKKATESTILAKKYKNGLYDINSKTKIYVNTGIGTTHINARLGVPPEITEFTIYL